MIFYHIVNSTNMYKLLFQLIVMCCSFFIFYFNIQKEYQNNLILNEELVKSSMQQKLMKRLISFLIKCYKKNTCVLYFDVL